MLRNMRRALAAMLAALTTAAMLGATALAAPEGDSLRPGDSGPAVEDLQKLLMKVGCFDYGEITGYYGDATEAGVRKFQSTHGLTVDGVAGSGTMQKLRAATKNDKTLKPDSICLGMQGQEVEDIQKRLQELGLYTEPEITGYYGPKTESAVMAFQEAAGINPDGIVGAKTKKSLFSGFKSESLVPGMKGDKVEKLQQRLKDLGYYAGEMTGIYGQLVQKAVAYFQRLNGLQEDGIAGKKTQSAIYAGNARKEKDARRSPAPSSKYQDKPGQSAKGQETCASLVAFAKKYLGCPYVLGAQGPKTFDCSGLTYFVYQHYGVTLPRKAYGQGYTNYGIKITDRTKLMVGDLVFFNADRRDGDLCDHVGIYLGGGNFIHSPAPGSHVKISSLTHAKDFSWGRRVFS